MDCCDVVYFRQIDGGGGMGISLLSLPHPHLPGPTWIHIASLSIWILKILVYGKGAWPIQIWTVKMQLGESLHEQQQQQFKPLSHQC